jgi:hypothetical protein
MSTRTILPALLATLTAAAGLSACTSDPIETLPDGPPAVTTPDAAPDAAADAAPGADAPSDAGPHTARICADDYDCLETTEPTCGPALLCVAPPDDCVGDDSNEPDDGPRIARPLPSSITASLCSEPGESDYYSFPVFGAPRVLHIADTGADLSVAITDATGQPITVDDTYPRDILIQTEGQFLVRLFRDGAASTTAASYTLTVSVPQCFADSDCPSSAPVCSVYACGGHPSP